MITYVNSSNLDKYEILFDRATALLKGDKENWDAEDKESLFGQFCIVNSNLSENEAKEAFENYRISSLNEYFAYLSTIAKMPEEQLSKEDKSYFLSLPLDEDTFNIDANSRIVTVPASFAKNGIGIQSEELAEVIYFAIDRYYDSTDLASNDLSIAIQWEKGAESGLCPNYGKFLAGTQGQQKLIFGWPITTTLTKTPGIVNFAVRIYSLDQDGFKYSFMTLPSAVQIKESLKGGGEDKAAFIRETAIEDASDYIINRIVNSTGIYDEHVPPPEVPIITKNIHFYTLKNDEHDEPIYDEPITETTYDLHENENINLAVSAKPGDAGVLDYAWHKTPFNTEDAEYNTADVIVDATTIIEFVKEAEDTLTPGQQYYTQSGDNYTLIAEPTAEMVKYIKMARISVPADNAPAGIYYPEVQARLLVNSSATTKDEVAKVTIPGPKFPEIAQGSSPVHILKDNNGNATITGTAITATDSSRLEAELVELDNSSVSRISISSGDRPEFTFSQGDNNKYYKINAYATRNKATVTTEGSIQYRVTAAPTAFTVGNMAGSTPNSELNMNDFINEVNNKENKIIYTNVRDNKPYIVLAPSGTQSDHCYYIWIDPKISIVASEGISSTDIIDKTSTYVAPTELNGLKALISSINSQEGEGIEVLQALLTDKIIKIGELDLANNAVVPWFTEEEAAQKYKDFDRGDADTYTPIFCLIVNELNGHYCAGTIGENTFSAAASTFYLV